MNALTLRVNRMEGTARSEAASRINVGSLPLVHRPPQYAMADLGPETVDEIILALEDRHQIPHAVFIGASRRVEIFWPRALAMFLSRNLTRATLQQLGEKFGNRDHGTISSAVRSVSNRMDVDSEFKAMVKQWETAIIEHYKHPAPAADKAKRALKQDQTTP